MRTLSIGLPACFMTGLAICLAMNPLSASPAPQEPAQASASGTNKDAQPITVGSHVFHRRTLANGLRAVAVKAEGRGVTVFVIIGAGKRQETPATTGLAHLTEHAMYTGTEKLKPGEHDQVIRKMGGESNAFTREDYTLYYDHQIPAEQLGAVLVMEADRLRNLTFMQAPFRMERERLRIEEKNTSEPASAREERVEAVVFRHHPYGAGVVDADGHTRAPTLELDVVRAFYNTYYRPDNAAVVVAGQIEPSRALDAIESAFSSHPRGSRRPPVVQEPVAGASRNEILSSGLTRGRCENIWLIPALGDPDRPALEVLARLFSRRTLADGSPVVATVGRRVDRDMFKVTGTGPDATKGLMKVMAAALADGFSDADIQEAKSLVADDYSSLPLRARPYFSLAGTFGIHEVFGHAGYLSTFEAEVLALDARKLVSVARLHLSPDRLIRVTFESSGAAAKPLPKRRKALAAAAQEAEAAGDYDRAIAAYTKLLKLKSSRMFTVIYLTELGSLRMKKKDYDGAIKDFETALAVVDYPAVRDLLKEARTLKNRPPEKKDGTDSRPGSGK